MRNYIHPIFYDADTQPEDAVLSIVNITENSSVQFSITEVLRSIYDDAQGGNSAFLITTIDAVRKLHQAQTHIADYINQYAEYIDAPAWDTETACKFLCVLLGKAFDAYKVGDDNTFTDIAYTVAHYAKPKGE